MEEQCEHPITEYERVRASRIKENMEKMRQLGINIHIPTSSIKEISKSSSIKAPKKKQQQKNHHLAIPRRASSRLTGKKGIGNEAYSSSDCDKASSMMKTEEVYNSEHEKLLGDCKNPWMVSDDDNKPFYDPINGITCHQCRQKTLGLRTDCNLCRLPHGRLCGTCLYKRLQPYKKLELIYICIYIVIILFCADMGKIYWKQKKIQGGLVRCVVEFVTAVDVANKKASRLLVIFIPRHGRSLDSNLWRII
ncbi:hypothetical protein ABFX02_01G112500 [Erythranthe guttata]